MILWSICLSVRPGMMMRYHETDLSLHPMQQPQIRLPIEWQPFFYTSGQGPSFPSLLLGQVQHSLLRRRHLHQIPHRFHDFEPSTLCLDFLFHGNREKDVWGYDRSSREERG